MRWVTEATYLGEYRLHISFNDGISGEVNLHPFLWVDHRPIFQQLRDLAQFQQFGVDMDTIVWANGADLAPEFLYDLIHAHQTQG